MPIDRYRAGAVSREAAQRMLRAYDAYDFPTVFQTLNTLATVDLSAFYVDVTKDRMYTFGARSPRAALDADGDVPDVRRSRAADCADPSGHRRRLVAQHARTALGIGSPRGISEGRSPAGARPRRRLGPADGRCAIR